MVRVRNPLTECMAVAANAEQLFALIACKHVGLRGLYEAQQRTRTADPFLTMEVLYQLS